MQIVFMTQGLKFNGASLEQPLGGSESALIYVAREMAKKHSVTVYCNCDEGVFDKVEYLNIQRLDEFIKVGYADVVIVSRFVQLFQHKFNSKLNILWNHDILSPEFEPLLIASSWNIDMMYFLSEYHKKQYTEILPEIEPIAHMNTNGVDFSLVTRKPKKHKIMYTSRPERGLWKALETYEKLNDKKLELLICTYGSIPNPEVDQIEKICAKKIQELANKGFQISLGSFNKKELYEHIAESKMVIYETDFSEISCISAMEAQANGTAYICSHKFALKETVGYDGVKKEQIFLDRVKEVLYDENLRKDIEDAGLEYVKKFAWDKVANKFLTDIHNHFEKRSSDVQGIIDRLVYESDIVQAREIAIKHDLDTNELDNMLRHLENTESQKEIYEDEETHERIDVDMEAYDKMGRFVWVSDKAKEYKIKTMLDFACHMGASSIKVSNDNKDLEITGYDLSESAIKKAKKRLDKYSKNKENITFTSKKPSGKYDAVFNGEMLEHVLEPEKMVDELETYVKPGGKMFITVPKGAWEWLSRKQNKEKDVVYHVNSFDYPDILDMFGNKKDLKVMVLPVQMWGAYGEYFGNYLVEYTVDGTPTGKRDLDRKFRTTRPHQTISVCMIGKDAEYTIEQTLESLQAQGGAIYDELILVDDNSRTDEMKRRTEKYGTVIKSPHSICSPDYWGFSNARNFGIEQAKGKWILWIDTDELLKIKSPLRKYLECTIQNAFVIRQFHPQRDNYIEADRPQRLFRNGTGKFYGYIHEQVQKNINEPISPALILDDVEIWNMGSALEGGRREKAIERNLPLLDRDWKENVKEKEAKNLPIRKLTPILVIRDLFNRMQWCYEQFGTYETREMKEKIIPRVFELYNKYLRDEQDPVYKDLGENIMQTIYEVLKLGHDVDLILDGKQLKKRYLGLDELVKDIKEL